EEYGGRYFQQQIFNHTSTSPYCLVHPLNQVLDLIRCWKLVELAEIEQDMKYKRVVFTRFDNIFLQKADTEILKGHLEDEGGGKAEPSTGLSSSHHRMRKNDYYFPGSRPATESVLDMHQTTRLAPGSSSFSTSTHGEQPVGAVQ
ncbi:unnamed protein product, partial [Amoebophrya sp. A120]